MSDYDDIEKPEIERLPHCEYGVAAMDERGTDDCGEPAVCRARWGNGDWLYLCEVHYVHVCAPR